ncbi:L-lactate permease [Paenalcaligenes sp. Me131]|uniref:L-lactate permease n=1 Tax=Paenalcaligenes sp. Me131 TaxID=3392636 RepID=UPI003D2BECB2
MTYFLWSLPTLTLLAAIVSGRVNPTIAATLGLACAVPVALLTGPSAWFDAQYLYVALLRGLWIGAVIAPYIVGGLLFWQVAARSSSTSSSQSPLAIPTSNSSHDGISKRRLVFFACFLVGPFAESATGFGVGMLGTVMLIRHLGFAPRHLMVFALLSQTVIPWGAMSSGTILAAAYARIPAVQLGLYSVLPVTLLMLVWLSLFWQTARKAGMAASRMECLREAGWIGACMVCLAATTAALGPETALLAAYGPLIVLRYVLDNKPTRSQALAAATKVLPYVVLIACLALTRLVPELRSTLDSLWRVTPFTDLPSWAPLFHAGSWLIVGSIVTAWVRGQPSVLGTEIKSAWATGKHAVLAVFLFAMMAEVLTASGISGAFAVAIFAVLGEKTILLTPPLSGAFGVLTNSGNPGNSLFLPSQVALAVQAGLSVPAVAALQQVSGMSLGLFSPVRMSIAATLSSGRGQERQVYTQLVPFAVMALMVLMVLALGVVLYR